MCEVKSIKIRKAMRKYMYLHIALLTKQIRYNKYMFVGKSKIFAICFVIVNQGL